jgi:hypothetical protein
LLFAGAAEYRLAANRILRTTRVCPPAPDEWPGLSGAGVAVFAASSNTTVANLITGNVPGGDTEFSGRRRRDRGSPTSRRPAMS